MPVGEVLKYKHPCFVLPVFLDFVILPSIEKWLREEAIGKERTALEELSHGERFFHEVVLDVPMHDNCDDCGVYVGGWKDLGYDSMAFINALALIGWNPGGDVEIMSLDDMINSFSLDRVNKSGARFDMDKAKWINSHHLKMMDVNELMESCLFHDDRFDLSRMEKIVHLAAARSSFKHEMQSVVDIFFDVPQFDVSKVTDDFKKFASVVDFSGVDFEDVIAIKQYIYEVCEKLSLKMGKIMPVMRYVLVGGISGPDMVTTCHILGKEETLKRIKC
jgi:glutamyl-tRNA synthetase